METCHFCGNPTTACPSIDWYLGRYYFAVCGDCVLSDDIGWDVPFFTSVHLVPEEVLARAFMFAEPEQEHFA